jgi:hypothetical protein
VIALFDKSIMQCVTSTAIILGGTAIAGLAEPQNVPVSELGTQFQLVGKLHSPFGRYITVEGVVVEGPFKGYEGGHNLRLQRIQNRATQEDIQIVIRPYFYKWGEKPFSSGQALPKLEIGKSYRMEGYETGGYVGTPAKAYREAGVALQTQHHYFRTEFVVVKAKRIDPISFAPGDFTGRRALLQGKAASHRDRALMLGNGWTVVVNNKKKWPLRLEGKTVEAYGLYNLTNDRTEFALVDGTARLVRLEDQIGQTVELRGTALSINDVWFFRYRGIDLYVENMTQLPGWSSENHERPMIIRGVLEKTKLPRLDQITEKPDRDLAEQYIVREASWEPIPALLSPERPFNEAE